MHLQEYYDIYLEDNSYTLLSRAEGERAPERP